MSRENLLLISDSVRDANMLYAVGLFLSDPFIYLQVGSKRIIAVSELEVDRTREQSRRCRVIPMGPYLRKLGRAGFKRPTLAHVAAELMIENGIRKVTVPMEFPVGAAKMLEQLKIKLKVAKGSCFPQREKKSADEVKRISAALLMAEVGMAEAIHAVKVSKIRKDRRLIHHGVPLTSEKLRSIIEVAVLQAGGCASQTIVSCGLQTCRPHERGQGLLRANEPIMIDIFPRSQKTGYYGDITRTVVKGKASEPIRKLYALVSEAQNLAFNQMRVGRMASEVHETVHRFFTQQGCRTGRTDGYMEGFFHAVGHGIGLELHEAPRVGPLSRDLLISGQVVTNEPGLYYPGVGGVRLEDVIHITRSGPKNLTRFEKVLEV